MTKKRSAGIPYAWLPDWKREDLYPDPDKTPMHQWAWEFLRRNGEYVRMWEVHVKPYYDMQTGAYDEEAAKLAAPVHIKLPVHEYIELENLETNEIEVRRHSIHAPYTLLEKRFHFLGIPPCPYKSEGGDIPFDSMTTPTIPLTDYDYARRSSRTYPARVEAHEVWCRFDLSLPLSEQLKRVDAILKQSVQQYKKERGLKVLRTTTYSRLYRNYLRVLDAKAQGAKNSEIVERVFPSEKAKNTHADGYQGSVAVQTAWEAATEIRDNSYWKIVVTSPKPKKEC